MPTATAALCRVALLLLVLTGCHRGSYRAGKLPAQFAAPAYRSAQHLDLSHLSYGTLEKDVVYAGDLVNVSIATGLETRNNLKWTLRVSDDGSIIVPLIGPVNVAGRELALAEAAIREASVARGIYRNPQVSMTLEQRRSNQVTVLGAVKKEGSYELPSNRSDLLSSIVAAGGLTEEADTIVEIRRPNAALAARPAGPYLGEDGDSPEGAAAGVTQVGYSETSSGVAPPATQIDIASPGTRARDEYRVEDGGVVMVMRRPKRTVQVLGLVKKPGQFEIPLDHDLRLLDAVAMAGGLTTELADKVLVVRNLPNQNQTVVIRASLDKTKTNQLENIRLTAGDVVSVEETPLTFTFNEITKLLRFSVSAASRVTLF